MESIRCPGCMRIKTERPLCEHCGYNEKIDNYSHHLPIGTMLQGRYEVGKVLGQGGFGITYIGWDHKKQMTVAIKEFYPRSLVNRENSRSNSVVTLAADTGELFDRSKARFLKEGNILYRLNDIPEIVHIYKMFEENNTAYMVMEYLKGADLRKYIRMKGGRISLEKTLTVMRPIMRVLQRVHDENLVHRDISPDNIMLLPGGAIKLLDFGAAREVLNADPNKNLSHSTETILKHGFAPIEQYQSSGTLGPWTDVYALTATIYFCLTGIIPPEAHKRLLDGAEVHWDTIPGLNPGQIQALNKAMALLPTERIKSVKELEELVYAGIPERRRKPDLNFHVENGSGAGQSGEDATSAVDDWKFTSGGGIANKTGTGGGTAGSNTSGGQRGKSEDKKKPKWGIVAAGLAAAMLVGGVAFSLLGSGTKLADPMFKEEADRTIRYDDGSRVEIFLDEDQQETGRLIRNEEEEILFQFLAEYDENGKATEQTVYDARGELLRTDWYTYNDEGILTRGESRNAKGSLIWKGNASFSDGDLDTFREEYADGSAVEWTYDENKNITLATYFDKDGNVEKSIQYTEFLAYRDTERQGRVDFFDASMIAARGGYGAVPLGNWDPSPAIGGGGPAPEKPAAPIPKAYEEEEETWPEETEAPTEEPEPTEDWSDVTLWVNSKRQELNADGNLVCSYETSYDDEGLAVSEICNANANGHAVLRHEAEFGYSGDELYEQLQVFPDGTETTIQYMRDICGNLIRVWTRSGDEPGKWEEHDPADSIVR